MNCLEFSKSGGRGMFSQWAYVAKYNVNRIKRKWRGILLRFWPSNQTHLRVWKHPQGDSLCHCETQQRRKPYTCQQFVSASVSGLEQWHDEPCASCARDAGSASALLLVCQQSSVKSSHQLAPQVSRKLHMLPQLPFLFIPQQWHFLIKRHHHDRRQPFYVWVL